MAGISNDAEKLNFLKCSLSDRPSLLINHLSYINENYQLALTILKREYLDVDEIIDQIFQDIIGYSPKNDLMINLVSRTYSL